MKKNSFIGEYEIVRKIGSGLTAHVYEAKSKKHGQVSIKSIEENFYKSKVGYQLIQNQLKVLASLNHKNVLKFIEKIEHNNKIHIVTEYCEGGDLESYMKRQVKLKEKEALSLVRQIVEGCIYLKQKNIVHRDLKPSNIFLRESKPIIADFGFAANLNDTTLMKLNAGSPLYMPFQSLASRNFSEKSDVFALGVCLFEMLAGKTPWTAKSQNELMLNIQTPPKISNQFSQSLVNLLLKCLSAESSRRPNFKQILQMINQILNSNASKAPLKISLPIPKIQLKKQKSLSFTTTMTVPVKKLKDNKQNIVKDKDLNKLKSMTVRENSIKKKSNKTDKNSSQFLEKVNPDQFSFLPQSVIAKFKCILHKYKRIIEPSDKQDYPVIIEKDSLIQEVEKCTTELQLCRSIESFIRRLFRLTKNYKDYNKCLINLEQLYARVTSIIV